MNRADRRRFDKEFAKIMKTASDNCTLCGKPFEHNCKTFGGFAANRKTVLTGECCAQNLVEVVTSGLYVTKYLDSFLAAKQGTKNSSVSHANMGNVVAALQSHVAKLDALSDGVMRRAGLQTQAQEVSLADTSWKADDAAWFKNHPERSHRMRPMFEGEAATLPYEIRSREIPEKHRLEVLVRQIEVGTRVRTMFCRNTEVPIPDSEAVIHAIFDVVSRPGSKGLINVAEIASLAAKYGASNSEKPN